jgi:hypothetical protein
LRIAAPNRYDRNSGMTDLLSAAAIGYLHSSMGSVGF